MIVKILYNMTSTSWIDKHSEVLDRVGFLLPEEHPVLLLGWTLHDLPQTTPTIPLQAVLSISQYQGNSDGSSFLDSCHRIVLALTSSDYLRNIQDLPQFYH